MEILLNILIIGYFISGINCAYSSFFVIENKQSLRFMRFSCAVMWIFFLMIYFVERMR